MTQPDGDRDEQEDADEEGEAFEPDDHPHPLRAEDCLPLIAKQIG